MSNWLELEPMYRVFRNVSDNPLIDCAVINKRNPRNNPFVFLIFLIDNGIVLMVTPNIPPNDQYNHVGFGGSEQLVTRSNPALNTVGSKLLPIQTRTCPNS